MNKNSVEEINPLAMEDHELDGTDEDEDTDDPGTPKKLTDWKNPPKLAELKQDLTDATRSHDVQKSLIEGWLDTLNITGKAKMPAVKGRSSIQPKLVRKQAEWRYGSLSEPFLSTDDVFNVKPITWEDKQAAEQNPTLLNNQFNTKIDKVSFIDEYVRTAVDEGTVIVRVGWKYEEEKYMEKVPRIQLVPDPSAQPLLEQVAQLQQQSPSQFATDVPDELKQALEYSMQTGIPHSGQIIGYDDVESVRVLANHPTVEVCDFRNLKFDPTCQGNLKKAKFGIYSFESSVADLTADGKYENLDKIDLNTNTILGQPDHTPVGTTQDFNFSDKARQKFIVHEYWGWWDTNGDGILKPIVAAWVGQTLIRMEANPFPDKAIPFVAAQYLPVRKSIYGEPDGALLDDNQKVIGAVTRGMIDIMGKSANGQTGMRKDMLDATNKRKFESGKDYEYNANVDPRVGVFMHTYPEIPNSAQVMLQMQNMEAESLTGVKSFSQGVSGASLGDVAAGIRGALDASSKRELGILRRLSNGIVEIGRKIISMNAEFLSDEEVIRITNEEFVAVRKDDLPGNFDLQLSISTAEEDNNKAEQLAFMLQTVGPNEDPGMRKLILSNICKLRKMPDLAKQIESYEPQPDPMQQQMQQLQMELMKSEIAKNYGMAQRDGATGQLAGAKVGTEQAKAAHLQSDTDIKNLDFVEQESGTKQERDLQKIGEQAKSQAGLASVQHGFDLEKQDRDHLKDYLLAKNK